MHNNKRKAINFSNIQVEIVFIMLFLFIAVVVTQANGFSGLALETPDKRYQAFWVRQTTKGGYEHMDKLDVYLQSGEKFSLQLDKQHQHRGYFTSHSVADINLVLKEKLAELIGEQVNITMQWKYVEGYPLAFFVEWLGKTEVIKIDLVYSSCGLSRSAHPISIVAIGNDNMDEQAYRYPNPGGTKSLDKVSLSTISSRGSGEYALSTDFIKMVRGLGA